MNNECYINDGMCYDPLLLECGIRSRNIYGWDSEFHIKGIKIVVVTLLVDVWGQPKIIMIIFFRLRGKLFVGWQEFVAVKLQERANTGTKETAFVVVMWKVVI